MEALFFLVFVTRRVEGVQLLELVLVRPHLVLLEELEKLLLDPRLLFLSLLRLFVVALSLPDVPITVV